MALPMPCIVNSHVNIYIIYIPDNIKLSWQLRDRKISAARGEINTPISIRYQDDRMIISNTLYMVTRMLHIYHNKIILHLQWVHHLVPNTAGD